MKRKPIAIQTTDPRSQYDRGAWDARRPAAEGDGGTEPELAGEPEEDSDEGPGAARRTPLGLSEGGESLLPLEALSTEELQRELARRQGDLKRMISRRNRLAEQLAELEARIKSLGGEIGAGRGEPRRADEAPRATRTRSKNEISLSDAIALAVEVRATVSPTEVAQLVQANGYRSTSKNFAMMVANALAKDKRFRRLARGQYERVV